jgi:hypothetical protein
MGLGIDWKKLVWRETHMAQTLHKKGFITRSQYAMALDKLGYDSLTIVEILETEHIPYKHEDHWVPTDEARIS